MLVTGSRGRIGAVVAAALRRAGHASIGFDAIDGGDVRDLAAVRRAMRGCQAIVHLAALAHDTAGPPADIMAVNVLGTWHVLQAAREAGVERVVHFSSAQVLGIMEGERPPDYLPVDDAHPLRASRPYGISKRLTEEMCDGFTAGTGIPTVCFRPVWVCDERTYERIEAARGRDPAVEWEPFWEYGAHVHVADVAAAVELALTRPLRGHARLLLCSGQAWTSAPSRDMARRLLPGVPWRGGSEYESEPYRSLVDASGARERLGWTPRHARPNGRALSG
ncbi:MAG TPA: NAD(P)-dependent oxidoreductase [Candidatus Dormibacteraeota bacterium]|nr:NAD(P)-dependent oxidoreductase [Candidatus Dormibacteraeota bacterium]